MKKNKKKKGIRLTPEQRLPSIPAPIIIEHKKRKAVNFRNAKHKNAWKKGEE